MNFSELGMGDRFCFSGHSDREAYEVVGPHQARRVNRSEVRNVGDREQVWVLGTEVDRRAAERRAMGIQEGGTGNG